MSRKLGFFATLYFLQGAAFAYASNFQKPFLAAQGVSKEALGLFTSLLLIPFIAKVFLGWLSDRYPIGGWGSRKPYMVLGLALFSFGYAVLILIHPSEQFFWFVAISWAASFGLAWFDTCCDGWAVDASGVEEQSAIQAAMVSGRSFGLVSMSAAFGFLTERSGVAAVFSVLAAMAAMVLLLVVLTPHTSAGKVEARLAAGFKWPRWPMVVFGLFGVFYSVSSFGVDGLVTLFLSETKSATAVQIGEFGVWRGLGALVGAVVFAWMARRVSLKHLAPLAMVGVGLGCALPLMILTHQVLGGVWGFFWGFQETAYVTMAMSFARGPWAATLFAMCMIFSNVGTALGEALAAPMVPSVGYAMVFLALASLAFLVAPLAWWVGRRFTVRRSVA